MNISKREAKINFARFCHIRNGEIDGDFMLNPKTGYLMFWGDNISLEERKAICEEMVQDGVFVRHEGGTYSLKRKWSGEILRLCLFKFSDFALKMGALGLASSLLKKGKRL